MNMDAVVAVDAAAARAPLHAEISVKSCSKLRLLNVLRIMRLMIRRSCRRVEFDIIFIQRMSFYSFRIFFWRFFIVIVVFMTFFITLFTFSFFVERYEKIYASEYCMTWFLLSGLQKT